MAPNFVLGSKRSSSYPGGYACSPFSPAASLDNHFDKPGDCEVSSFLFDLYKLGIQITVANDGAKRFPELHSGDPLSWLLVYCSCWGGTAQMLRDRFMDLSPRSWSPVADVVRLAGFPVLQRSQADPGQVCDMNQIDIIARGAHAAGSDPVDGIAAWTVDSGHAQHDRATVSSQELFPLHTGFGQIDRRRFVDPGRRVLS